MTFARPQLLLIGMLVFLAIVASLSPASFVFGKLFIQLAFVFPAIDCFVLLLVVKTNAGK